MVLGEQGVRSAQDSSTQRDSSAPGAGGQENPRISH